jgi:hypothetical protein
VPGFAIARAAVHALLNRGWLGFADGLFHRKCAPLLSST